MENRAFLNGDSVLITKGKFRGDTGVVTCWVHDNVYIVTVDVINLDIVLFDTEMVEVLCDGKKDS